MSLDYRAKYKELKAKLIESTDVAYRLGFEAGLKQAMQDQAQMQIQQAQQQAMQMQAMMGGGQEMSPEQQAQMQDSGDMPASEAQMPMQDQMQDMEMQDEQAGSGSELDQYINELEGLVAKGQKPNVLDLRKVVTELADLRKNQKAKMKENKPQVISAQKKLVDNILKKWELESKMTVDNLEDTIKEFGLKLD